MEFGHRYRIDDDASQRRHAHVQRECADVDLSLEQWLDAHVYGWRAYQAHLK